MATSAVFPAASARAGMHESFFLRAVSPSEPQGVWLRYTAEKRPCQRATGSLWCTIFDARRGRPYMHRLAGSELTVPPGGWIAVDGARLTPAAAEGCCGAARWSLRFASDEPELRHLPRELLYRAPLPRTKLTTPLPAATFDGTLALSERAIELDGWRGMVGHNWGSAHADRWIWMHGVGFAEEPRAWLELALGRVRLAGRLSPWVASGTLALGGDRGLLVKAEVRVPEGSAAAWRYSDPSASLQDGRDVINCSVAALELAVRLPGAKAWRRLQSAQ